MPDRPNCGYSLRMVLKQCGQLATMVRIPWVSCAAERVATFSCASLWKRYSLPARRAGSPLQVSRGPSTANGRPAWASSCAIARTTLRLRSSKAPAHPTQYRTPSPDAAAPSSVLSELPAPSSTDTPSPFAQSRRELRGWPQGLPAVSILRKATLSSLGKRLSSRTRLRRISTIESTCSINTGQPSTHQPQVVHCQTASSGMALSTSGRLSASAARSFASRSDASDASIPVATPPRAARCDDAAAESAVSAATIWSRRPSMKCLGDSVLPVMDAGQNSMQRPHSVQDSGSSR